MSHTSRSVRIVEVGARDGLQNVATSIPTATKSLLIEKLLGSNLKTVELTSIVSPKAIPQLADYEQLLSQPNIVNLLSQDNGLRLPVLVPNTRGLQKGIALQVKEIAVFVSAAEGFSRANINCTVEQGLQRAIEVTRIAKSSGLAIRGYVSCIFACPYDGPTPCSAVIRCVKQLLEAGCYEVSLGDTLGVGTPGQTRALLHSLFDAGVEPAVLAGHFHDTYGQALANAWEAYLCGLKVFDSSVAGLGGCPFAPGARGNLASEDLVFMFERSGIDTGVDLQRLIEVGAWISEKLGIPNGSRAGVASINRQAQKPASGPVQPERPVSTRVPWLETERTDSIVILRAGRTIKIVMDRPKNGNALTVPMIQKLTTQFESYQNDCTVSRIILTGKGKFFCTGMDLSKEGSAVAKGTTFASTQYNLLSKLFCTIENARQVTIASINGPCYGGGVGLALACDIRIATRTASMTLSEVKLGLVAATISKYVLREMGIAFAREALLSARSIPAEELKIHGIITVVTQDVEQLQDVTDEYVSSLRQCAPEASRASKELVNIAWKAPGSQQQDDRAKKIFEAMMNPGAEAAKGLVAFQRGQRNLDWDQIELLTRPKL